MDFFKRLLEQRSDGKAPTIGQTNIVEALNAGNKHFAAGDFADAIAAYDAVLSADADNVPALANRAAVLNLSGHREEAERAFIRVLELDPESMPAHFNLALLADAKGNASQALIFARRAHALAPGQAEPALLIGQLLIAARRYREAWDHLNGTRPLHDRETAFWPLLGAAALGAGLTREAVAVYRHVAGLATDPDRAIILTRLGRALTDAGHFGEALALCRVTCDPSQPNADTAINLSRALVCVERTDDAIAVYETVLANWPKKAEANTNLGNLFKKKQMLDKAEDHYRKALAFEPGSAVAHRNLADLLASSLRLKESLESFEHACDLAPNNPYLRSDLNYALHYDPDKTQDQLADAMRGWSNVIGLPAASQMPVREPRTHPLRIGLISGSFRQHPVAFLSLSALEQLDRSRFSIFCYANHVDSDTYTNRFKALSQGWRTIAHLSDGEVDRIIRRDRLDVLIDMAGHAAGHRLPVLLRRPAPVQVKWVGGQYNTMGTAAFDYFLSDSTESPPDADDTYIESIYRLPEVYACYEAPTGTPDVNDLPARRKGHVTFGCFNKINKLNETTFRLWNACLDAVQDSRLILKAGEFADPSVCERARAMMREAGIDTARVKFEGFTAHPDLFARYHDIDIALDPFPYTGCLTTCEALWMGVPVVTLPGPSFAGRHSASFLTAVGLKNWIAKDEQDYVRIIKQAAHGLDELQELRHKLRQRVQTSPLGQPQRLATHLAEALTFMISEIAATQAA